jgi:hypothetical protein
LRQEQKEEITGATHALVHWLPDVHSGSFTPAHLSESEFSECMNLQNKKKYKSQFRVAYTTDNQFYEINSLVDSLCQLKTVDTEKIDVLNRLLLNYKKKN